jgi:hypothetical protein
MDHFLALAKYGPRLWTRDTARPIRSDVEELLEMALPGDAVVVNAKGVEVFDYSFANELFGKTIINLPVSYPGRFFVVEGLTEHTHENLVKALESLSLIMIERKGRRLLLIGKTHPTDVATFDAIVRAKGPVTANELRIQLDINLTAVNERLSKLTSLGLLRREKSASAAGREQYAYSVLS